MKLPISVCLIVRDEEATLPACLESVAPFFAQIVVVDTGSQDRTAEIARAFGADVYHLQWCDDFSAARNYAADQAHQPFIFALDADERVVPSSMHTLEAYCRAVTPRAGRVRLTNVEHDLATAQTVEHITRLYPNAPGYRYHGRVHEQMLLDGQPPSTSDTGVEILHTGYAGGPSVMAAKVTRNLRLLEMLRAENGADPYVLFQIGRTHAVGQAYAEAAAAFEEALQCLVGRSPAEVPYLPTLFLQLVYARVSLHDFAAAFETLAVALDLFPDFTDLYFAYGQALTALGDAERLDDIRAAFEYCLTLGELDGARYETVVGVGSYRAQYNLGVLAELRGDWESARAWYAQASAAGFPLAIERLRSHVMEAGCR